VRAMTATIVRLPVAMKRGRKVTKGPMASVSVMYTAPTRCTKPQLCLEEEMEKLAQLAAARMLRMRQQRAEYEAWIDSSPALARFPESARFRSEEVVDRLRRGLPEFADEEEEDCGSPMERAMDDLAVKVSERAKEILSSRGEAQ